MKAALVGLGRMGLRHLDVLRGHGLEVVGAADRSEAALAKAEALGIPRSGLDRDARVMLRRVRAACVVVATTAPSHCELVTAAAEAGAEAILCEKPMAVSLAECDRMLAACRASGSRLAVNHQMRFMEQYTRPREIATGAAFGGLASVTVVAGNFGLAMNGSHYIEMFRYMTGARTATVAAWFSGETVANPRGAEFVDRAGCLRLETADGRRFYMDAGTDQGHGMHVSYAGRNGRLDVDELTGHMRLVVRRAEHRSEPTTRYGMPAETTEQHIAPADAVAPTRAVLAALLGGRDWPSGEDGRAVVEVLAAAYLSHERGGATIDLATAGLERERTFPWA